MIANLVEFSVLPVHTIRMLDRSVLGVVLVIGAGSLIAQQPQGTPASHKRASITVPFVGCRSDGQVGPVEAAKGTSPSLSITPKETQQLAYYSLETGLGVLAPRGWYCFGTYGSGASACL